MLFVIVILIYIIDIIYLIYIGKTSGFGTIFYAIIDGVLLGGQIYLMKYYRKKMIDLEMDYNIIIPGRLYFINQSDMMGSTQTLNSVKIKTVKDVTSGFFSSFFNLGSVNVLTEGDQGNIGVMDMHFVDNPKETVKYIYELMGKEGFKIKNNYLKKCLVLLEIEDIYYDTPENINKIKAFLKENDSNIKEDYKKGDIIVKKEIEELYSILTKK